MKKLQRIVSVMLIAFTMMACMPALAEETAKAPKYVFLFIGDGMSYPQFQAAADYLGAMADEDAEASLPSTSYDSRNGATLEGPIKLNLKTCENLSPNSSLSDRMAFRTESASLPGIRMAI